MFLGIDIGTGSTKGVLVTSEGRILDREAIEHNVSTPRPGWFEFDAEQIWWAEIQQISRTLLSRAELPLQGVCVSGMGPCLVVTGEDLKPLRPAILYGVDSRAGAEIDELNQELGAEKIFERCGKQLSSQSVGPKVRWLAQHEPEVFAATRRIFSLNSFIVARLTGEYIQDHHSASQSDPLYDLHSNDWIPEHWQKIVGGVPAPRLVWPAEVVGSVSVEAARLTGIPSGTPVCAGTVDAWAEAFSAGVRQPGDTMLMYGSTLFVVQILQNYQAHEKLWTTTAVEPGSLSLAAGTSTSGTLASWMRQLFGQPSFEQLIAEAERVPPGSNGLLLLPYFAGERTPIFDPQARGAILGLTTAHQRGHLFRAGYEGIGYGARQIMEFLAASAERPSRLVAVGGGTQSKLWTQVTSDITGYAQEIPAETIGASYGDALMAAIGTGAVEAKTDWSRITEIIHPEPRRQELYQELYSIFSELYPATRKAMHQLAALQR
ncbi:xylulokinase [Psychromicrobium silvestre]|uniref:Xylulokinase n=1 Tax=Psychromicrobium silvestre TaxID=1645614 RepID=A0A7Y9LS59_9MICC|nr:FGGY-family carbohydrate kinase [Psychromicrobium silvestre]NYE94617.1 xylulokinase [Psychromicrobium silvestre]